ncbi:beta-galactosidase trimerization domain-containing protein [Pinibacter soli]|uniref:Beta-galactosidase trimerization domain-containing protein n=1 Tax=Pinibacter soli TaxID=3044211 RepID=A0ABT6R8Z2_9BACT|nr:beta-galactosidase trimerization domain-containing protein [Pinibacter soli]MDI3318359.1 beta-galactosidase trimerization domain-containing protein [Pinibacter soli]
MHRLIYISLLVLGIIFSVEAEAQSTETRQVFFPEGNSFFPSSIQFTPLASECGGDTAALQRRSVEDIYKKGFNTIWVRSFSNKQAQGLLKFAQQQGMSVDFMTNGFELFDRYAPPAISVYAPDYEVAVRKKMKEGLLPVKELDVIRYIFPFQDEPFHAGPESFDYSRYAKKEFRRRFGYEMPDSLPAVKNDCKKWIDFLNFQSNTFSDGWEKVYKIAKTFEPRAKVAMTHDSHNSFGAGVKSNSKVAIDDVFQWGGSFADVYVYDIYPYHTFDYRYGELGKLPKPRMSQMHYAISQLRNVTTTYNKDLGFWVGTYNENWFTRFRGPERESQYWAEREMAYTAIAQGANYLISPSNYTGVNVPVDSSHWTDYARAMQVIQKAGPALLNAPKVKANACFLFPRTQYLLLQEEYFNVGLSFELFLRAFGELDILHENQVTDDKLNDYKVLVLADVKLLPASVAAHISRFVQNGGIVIADCVPQLDENKKPLSTMTKLFGINKAETGRVLQEGQWVPFANQPPKMSFPPSGEQSGEEIRTDELKGDAFNKQFDFKIVSPRYARLTNGKPLMQLASGRPALIRNNVGKGKAYAFCFCLQDNYFQTYKDSSDATQEQLLELVSCTLKDAKVQSHIYSSNHDIEATVRANAEDGYIFIINHETMTAVTTIRFTSIGFRVAKIVNVETGRAVAFKATDNAGEFNIDVPFGSTCLLRLYPSEK